MVKRPKTMHEAFRDLQDAWHELVFEVRKGLHLDRLLDYIEAHRLEVGALGFWLGFVGVLAWVVWVWR